MLLVPTLPKCTRGGDHGLIRFVKTHRSFEWKCLLCEYEYTIYIVGNNYTPVVYERSPPDERGSYTEWRLP